MGETGRITVTVNGQRRELDAPVTVAALIDAEGLAGKPCAAELNRAVVPKREHAGATLADGDTVELVTLVGGG